MAIVGTTDFKFAKLYIYHESTNFLIAFYEKKFFVAFT